MSHSFYRWFVSPSGYCIGARLTSESRWQHKGRHNQQIWRPQYEQQQEPTSMTTSQQRRQENVPYICYQSFDLLLRNAMLAWLTKKSINSDDINLKRTVRCLCVTDCIGSVYHFFFSQCELRAKERARIVLKWS